MKWRLPFFVKYVKIENLATLLFVNLNAVFKCLILSLADGHMQRRCQQIVNQIHVNFLINALF